MKCDKYMGMDVHQAMTVVVVLDADGRVILETMVATEAASIIRLVQSLSGPLHVTFEETTQARNRRTAGSAGTVCFRSPNRWITLAR